MFSKNFKMNHTSCLLVLLVAMKMLAVRSAPLMAIEDSDVSKVSGLINTRSIFSSGRSSKRNTYCSHKDEFFVSFIYGL